VRRELTVELKKLLQKDNIAQLLKEAAESPEPTQTEKKILEN